MKNLTGSGLAWVFLGIPAILGWIVMAISWLIAPRFGFEPNYVMHSLYGMGFYYLLIASFSFVFILNDV